MKKCPCCGSTKITENKKGDLDCKKCNYILLSEETRKSMKNEVFQNSKK